MVASYLEVYNDQIFDLLDESGNRKVRPLLLLLPNNVEIWGLGGIIHHVRCRPGRCRVVKTAWVLSLLPGGGCRRSSRRTVVDGSRSRGCPSERSPTCSQVGLMPTSVSYRGSRAVSGLSLLVHPRCGTLKPLCPL